MEFRASWDTATKLISASVVALLLAIAFTTKSVIAGGLIAVLFAVTYAWSPAGYSVSAGTVVIRRLIGNIVIPAESIRQVRTAAAEDFRGCLRIFGSGGLFGYYGTFRTAALGKSTWYITNRSHAVVLSRDSGTVLVSPDDVDGFIAALGKPAPTTFDAEPPGMSLGTHWIQMAALIVAVAAVVGLVFYSPGPPAYTLTKESLVIHDTFYPVTLDASTVDTANVRMIDMDGDSQWWPVLRTNGFATAHYHSGWFRVGSGKTVRMYRADGKRLVLLPPKGDGTPVLLETKDPEGFIRQIQKEWE